MKYVEKTVPKKTFSPDIECAARMQAVSPIETASTKTAKTDDKPTTPTVTKLASQER